MTSQPAGERGLSLFDAVLLVCGAVVGIGIFFTPTQIASQVSSPGMFLGVWIAAGVLTLLGCFTISELGAAFPREGGIYLYLSELVGPMWAFLYGWSAIWIASTGGLAVVAMFMGENLSEEHGALIGVGALLGFGALCALGLQVGARSTRRDPPSVRSLDLGVSVPRSRSEGRIPAPSTRSDPATPST